MPRVKKEVLEEVVTPIEESPEVPTAPIEIMAKPMIAPLSFEFGRDDLNSLQAKVNEIIEKING